MALQLGKDVHVPSCDEVKTVSVNREVVCMLCLFPKGNPSVESGKICGTFQGRNGKWENQVCDRKLGYICQKRNSSSDSSTITSGKFIKK